MKKKQRGHKLVLELLALKILFRLAEDSASSAVICQPCWIDFGQYRHMMSGV